MENQRPAERGHEEDEDRISELPEPILEHVISLLPQKLAVGTCILSKSWRHLGPTRPKIEFDESSDFPKSKEKFLPVVENTLRRYVDQKLSVQEFVLSMSDPCPTNISNSLLNKWIVKLHMLKRFELKHVYIEDKTFEKIMSSCPSIEHLVLDSCQGLSSVKVNKARNLKHLDCHEINGSIEIDDAPSLETIDLSDSEFHLHNSNNNYISPRLKYLYLCDVHLTTELLDNLSSNNCCPCLQVLELHGCYGFTEIKLSNRSIKRLIIDFLAHPLTKVSIDAASMLYFEFSSGLLPSNVSFATTSRECKSRITVWLSYDADDVSSSTWYRKLHEFLRAISQSQISLDIGCLPELMTNQDSAYDCGISEPPVVVEHLCFKAHYSSSFLNCVFRICRPRYINLPLCSQLTGHVWKTLVNKGETTQCHFWQQDLEKTSIQVLDNKTNVYVWRDVHQLCEFPNNDEEIRLRLKWRDLNCN